MCKSRTKSELYLQTILKLARVACRHVYRLPRNVFQLKGEIKDGERNM